MLYTPKAPKHHKKMSFWPKKAKPSRSGFYRAWQKKATRLPKFCGLGTSKQTINCFATHESKLSVITFATSLAKSQNALGTNRQNKNQNSAKLFKARLLVPVGLHLLAVSSPRRQEPGKRGGPKKGSLGLFRGLEV